MAMRKYAQKFPRVFSQGNFTGIATADVTCQPYQYNLVGTLTVPAQQAIGWGATDIINGGQTGSAVYIRFDASTGTQLQGTIRMSVADANLLNEQVVLEQRTERLSADKSDRAKCVLLREDVRKAEQDSKLLIRFLPDGASAVTIMYNATNTAIITPVTVLQ